jgi:hypothetical protein
MNVLELANFLQMRRAYRFFRDTLVAKAEQASPAVVIAAAATMRRIDLPPGDDTTEGKPSLCRELWARATVQLARRRPLCDSVCEGLTRDMETQDTRASATAAFELYASSLLRDLYDAYGVVAHLSRELVKLHRDNARLGFFSGMPRGARGIAGTCGAQTPSAQALDFAASADSAFIPFVDCLRTKARALKISRALGWHANHQGLSHFAKYCARKAIRVNNDAAQQRGSLYSLGLDHESYLFQFGLCEGTQALFAGLGAGERSMAATPPPAFRVTRKNFGPTMSTVLSQSARNVTS